MVEKAKLDVLENLPDIELTDLNSPMMEQEESSLPVAQEKWAFNKILLIGMPAIIVVLVITGLLWFYLSRTDTTVTKLKSVPPAVVIEKKPANDERISAPVAVEPVKMNNAYFKDFIIDLKDKAGKSKILLCDVVFDVSEAGIIAELENRNDIRNLIYQTATGRNAVVLKSIEERKRLKKELVQELNKMLGDGIVKNVYFTNYVIM